MGTAVDAGEWIEAAACEWIEVAARDTASRQDFKSTVIFSSMVKAVACQSIEVVTEGVSDQSTDGSSDADGAPMSMEASAASEVEDAPDGEYIQAVVADAAQIRHGIAGECMEAAVVSASEFQQPACSTTAVAAAEPEPAEWVAAVVRGSDANDTFDAVALDRVFVAVAPIGDGAASDGTEASAASEAEDAPDGEYIQAVVADAAQIRHGIAGERVQAAVVSASEFQQPACSTAAVAAAEPEPAESVAAVVRGSDANDTFDAVADDRVFVAVAVTVLGKTAASKRVAAPKGDTEGRTVTTADSAAATGAAAAHEAAAAGSAGVEVAFGLPRPLNRCNRFVAHKAAPEAAAAGDAEGETKCDAMGLIWNVEAEGEVETATASECRVAPSEEILSLDDHGFSTVPPIAEFLPGEVLVKQHAPVLSKKVPKTSRVTTEKMKGTRSMSATAASGPLFGGLMGFLPIPLMLRRKVDFLEVDGEIPISAVSADWSWSFVKDDGRMCVRSPIFFDPENVCGKSPLGPSALGAIVVLHRPKDLSRVDKLARAAQDAGAVALVVVNNKSIWDESVAIPCDSLGFAGLYVAPPQIPAILVPKAMKEVLCSGRPGLRAVIVRR